MLMGYTIACFRTDARQEMTAADPDLLSASRRRIHAVIDPRRFVPFDLRRLLADERKVEVNL